MNSTGQANGLTRTLIVALCLGVVAIGTSFAEQKTLYERLGGFDAISAVVDDFAAKLFNDPVVGKRFFGMSDDSRESFRQKNKNLVCNVTGGPCKIISRPAATAHGGLGIKASEFGIVAQHLVDTLNKFKVPEKEHKGLMAIIATLRPDIVEVEGEEPTEISKARRFVAGPKGEHIWPALQLRPFLPAGRQRRGIPRGGLQRLSHGERGRRSRVHTVLSDPASRQGTAKRQAHERRIRRVQRDGQSNDPRDVPGF